MATSFAQPTATPPAAVLCSSGRPGRHASAPVRIRAAPAPQSRIFGSSFTGAAVHATGAVSDAVPRGHLQIRSAGFGGFGDKRKKDHVPCPCGGREEKLSYKDCCEQFHTYKKKPQNALELMKSRYSAYAKGKVDWVVTTTHPDHPCAAGSKLPDGRVVTTLVQDVKATCSKVQFLGLEVHDHRAGDTPNEEFVRFTVSIQMKGQKGGNKGAVEEITEDSFFTRGEDGKWLYRAGAPEGSEEEKDEARRMADEVAAKMGAKAKK